MSSEALRKDRRTKLRQFFRVGMFAIAIAISAIVLVRVLAVKRQTDLVTEKLQFAERRGEELQAMNEELNAASKLSDSLYPAACTNGEFIQRFYQLCREPSDLPPIKTDFIVGCNYVIDLSPKGIAFSVPDGSHTLELTIDRSIGGKSESGQSTKIEFPLLPSAGYFVRFISVEDPESVDDAQLFIELNSNNQEFKTIRQALPVLVGRLKDRRFSNHFTFNGDLAVMRRQLLDLVGAVGHLTYPSGSSIARVGSEQSVEVATGSISGHSRKLIPLMLHLNIVSDARPSIARKMASLYQRTTGPYEPYTGNGRIYRSAPPRVSGQDN